MNDLDEIDHTQPGFGELYDELPLWSAPGRNLSLAPLLHPARLPARLEVRRAG